MSYLSDFQELVDEMKNEPLITTQAQQIIMLGQIAIALSAIADSLEKGNK